MRKFKMIGSFVFTFVCMQYHAMAQNRSLKTIKCPLDGNVFEAIIIANENPSQIRRDLEKTGVAGYYEHLVCSCPVCHFSAYVSDFNMSLDQNQRKNLLLLLDMYKDVKITHLLERDIAVKIYTYLNKSNASIANLYLEASYLLKKDASKTELRKMYQKQCLDALKYVIENNESNKPTTYYLMAEMQRRTGDFESAIWNYKQAMGMIDKPVWLDQWATEQLKLAEVSKDIND